MNSNTVFLLDLDDTLFNTEQYKTDLFNKIGHVINPTGVAAQGGAEIAAIYNLYRQNNPVYNPNEFAQFLSSTFGYEAEIRDCFETDYTQYVLREAYSRMGIKFSMKLIKRGYYPKGGGEVNLEVLPSTVKSILLYQRSFPFQSLLLQP